MSNLCLIIIGTHFWSEFCLMHYVTATHDQTKVVGQTASGQDERLDAPFPLQKGAIVGVIK